MDVYHVIVKKKDGTISRSDKESETSAVKSAKAFVTLRGEPGAVVLRAKKVVFEIPPGMQKDTEFMAIAQEKAYENGTKMSAPTKHATSTHAPPLNATQTKLALTDLAAEFDQATKSGAISIPTVNKKPKPCNMMDILESVCLALSLSRGITVQAAREICEQHRAEMEPLAASLTSGAITRDEAIRQLVSLLTKTVKITAPLPSESPIKPLAVEGPHQLVNMTKIMRGRKGLHFDATRVRFDIAEDADMMSSSPTSLPAGIMIYFTKDVDTRVHEIVATAHGYTGATWINSHDPSLQPGYDYQKILSLGRPTYKSPVWTASGGRVARPADLINQLRTEFPEEKVLVVVAAGVELI